MGIISNTIYTQTNTKILSQNTLTICGIASNSSINFVNPKSATLH